MLSTLSLVCLGGYFEASAYVVGDQFAGIFGGTAVHGTVFALVQQQVVAHTATDERFLDTRQGIDRLVRCRAADGDRYSGWDIPWGVCTTGVCICGKPTRPCHPCGTYWPKDRPDRLGIL